MFRRNKAIIIETAAMAVLLAARFALDRAALAPAWVMTALDTLFICLFCVTAYPLAKEMVEEIRNEGNLFSESFLMLLSSLVALFIGDSAEAVAIVALFRIGESLADRSAEKGKEDLRWLLDLHQRKCSVLVGGEKREMAVGDIEPGMRALLVAGDVVPFDCRIASGRSFFDTSAITGESDPVALSEGDELPSGYAVVDGTIEVVALRPCSQSAVANILRMIDEVSKGKSKPERMTARFIRIYTPAVIAASFAVGILPPLLSGSFDFAAWAYRAASILVASCPCSVALSVPLVYFTGSAALAKLKVFVKSSDCLDTLGKANVFCFDKTGTLTDGGFDVTEWETDMDEVEFKTILASAESFSRHPVAKAINEWWKEFSKPDLIQNPTETAGVGISFDFNGRRCSITSGARSDGGSEAASGMRHSKGKTVAFLCDGDALAGKVWLSDNIRPCARETIAALESDGVSCAMFTGDRSESAEAVAKALSLTEWKAQMTPADKLESIGKMKERGDAVVFVGDGINDAGALAAADVSVAMGGVSSESIRQASDVILEGGRLDGLVAARRVSKSARRIAIYNIVASVALKAAVITLSLLGLTRIWLNVFADSGMLILCVLNSLRVRGAARRGAAR